MPFVASGLFIGALLLGVIIVGGSSSIVRYALVGVLGLVAVEVVLRRPYIGLALVAASSSINDILPDIPFITSFVPLMGGITLGAYILRRWWRDDQIVKTSSQTRWLYVIALILIGWMFVTHPLTSFGLGTADRNWMLTFIQLLLLLWLAGQIFHNNHDLAWFMVLFAAIVSISAILSIQDTVAVGKDFVRAAGIAGGANSAARYFTIAFVFWYYVFESKLLREQFRFAPLLGLAGMGVAAGGAISTASRTGAALIILAFGMMFFSLMI